MSDQENMSPPIPSIEEAYKFLKIVPHPDGSLTRNNHIPTLPATPDPDNSTGLIALSKDIPLNPAHNTSIRLFRPINRPPTAEKLPLIIDFHGGGFVFFSPATSFFHKSCSRMAAHTPALIASVDYRLAPEHRLPAAYEDGVEAVLWAKAQAVAGDGADPWVRELVDFSRVFLMGSSAGGNMVYQVGLRAVDLDLEPVRIVGLIMNEAFFGGVRRTGSEVRLHNDAIVPLHAADLLWSLALPEGADRGHEYCDPSAGDGPPEEKIRRLGPFLVRGYSGDPLVDKQKEFAQMVEARGGHVAHQFVDGGHHAVEIYDPKFAEALYDDIKHFVFAQQPNL